MDTITGMRTFCAVASEESFVKAATKLGISAALTSKYISQLEERLNVRLLNRTTRSLALTENGQAYFKRCLALIEEFDALEASVQDNEISPRGHLVISASVNFGETYLTDAVGKFLEKYPGISIDVRLSDRFVNIVEEGFDLAVRLGDLQDSTLIARKLAETGIVLCATPQYFDKHPAPEKPIDLAQHDCIIDTNFTGGDQWPFLINGEKKTIRVHGRLRISSDTATRTLLLRHMGIALCPEHVVAKDIAEGRLTCVLKEFNAFQLDLYAVYPHNRHLAVKVRVFVDFLVDYFSEISELGNH